MFKKFHWGHGLIIFFAIFIGLLATALVKSMQMDHNLVAKDYYAQDIAYQKRYDKVVNARRDGKDFQVNWDSVKGKYIIKFNDESKKNGIVQFYRPSDRKLDFSMEINTSREMEIDQKMLDGRWKISADWTDLDRQIVYFKEKDMFIATP